jgi:hypothetical protein
MQQFGIVPALATEQNIAELFAIVNASDAYVRASLRPVAGYPICAKLCTTGCSC